MYNPPPQPFFLSFWFQGFAQLPTWLVQGVQSWLPPPSAIFGSLSLASFEWLLYTPYLTQEEASLATWSENPNHKKTESHLGRESGVPEIWLNDLFITSTATLHKDKLPSACTPKKLRRKKTKGIPQKSNNNNNNTEPIHHRLHHELLLQGLFFFFFNPCTLLCSDCRKIDNLVRERPSTCTSKIL